QAYANLLQQANLTVSSFEADVKNEILEQKLAAMITGSASVSDADIRQEFQKRNTKVKFTYAVLSQDDIRKGLHPTDDELKAFYTRSKATYNNAIPEKRKTNNAIPEKGKDENAVLDKSKVLAEVQVTNDDLRSYYDQHRDQYRVPEEV